MMLILRTFAHAQEQQAGSLRGAVRDADSATPIAGAQVTAVETGQTVRTSEQGQFLLALAPGRYTLLFTKDGYVRQVKSDVLVESGRLTDVDVDLAGEVTELEEFVVQDVLQFGAGTEGELLKLRFESPALMDSISSDLMSRAGASDAAAALRLVAGASVQDGKSAVIRGLPDRYVSSQMNGVRLPTADENKRAVELDQFPSSVLESIRVSKTFTPDQQGDASGGAVDVRLKGVPDATLFDFKAELSKNTQVDRGDFLSYDGGGVGRWGKDDGGRDQQLERLGQSFNGDVGVSDGETPLDYKWSTAIGGKQEFAHDWKLGGFASFFYERDSSFYDDGVDDSFWVESPGSPMTPTTYQGTPLDGDFKTALYDVTQAVQSVQWGGLAAVGIESTDHKVTLSWLYTHIAEDKATLAVDTRGKEYFFPGYDPNDKTDPGNDPSKLLAAPYLRLETLEYTERTTSTLQLHGHDRFPVGEWNLGSSWQFLAPELDWVVAQSSADLDQPDKRQFGAAWVPPADNPGAPPFIPPFTSPPTWLPYKPGANFTLGNLQRIWKTIEEESFQYAGDLKFPFKQWTDTEGWFKFGVFADDLHRDFDQDTFSNFNDNSSFNGDFDDPWSGHFPFENHPITASLFDVDYKGDQKIQALYGMLDLPLTSTLSLIGGVRRESTDISIENQAEQNATWFPPGATAPIQLNPGDADVDFSQKDYLPAVGLVYTPWAPLTLRASYSQTVARQTFKELTPILQQEYLGGPIFIGNPELGMSSLKNYDARVDWTPYEGGLLSASYFYKHIEDPIEYVQRIASFNFTTAVNYPRGHLDGFELEVRQDLGRLWDPLHGLGAGANATFIQSEVTLPDDEAAGFVLPNINAPMTTRDMTNAPEHLYNFYLTYDLEKTGTQFAVFYTVQGDTLVAGAGQNNGNFVPSVYAKEYGTLNVSVTQPLGPYLALNLQAKNLTNPDIETVYRSGFIPHDVTHTKYTKGVEYSVALIAKFRF
jgi:outer membrane receptor protein involved in Fe transport